MPQVRVFEVERFVAVVGLNAFATTPTIYRGTDRIGPRYVRDWLWLVLL